MQNFKEKLQGQDHLPAEYTWAGHVIKLSKLAAMIRTPEFHVPTLETRSKMNNKTYKVLFLCKRNSARSIMAEALLNASGGGRFRAFSAGTDPAGTVNPFAIEQIKGFDIAPVDLRSKSRDEFSPHDAAAMDFVITVCDESAGEPFPQWPGQPATANWSFRDPAATKGSEAEVRQEFFTICREIKRRLEIFRNLPDEALEELALQRKIARIAGVAMPREIKGMAS